MAAAGLGQNAGWVQIGRMTPHVAGIVLWPVFLISWYAAMAWIAPAVRRNSVASRLGDNLVYALGFFLLLAQSPQMPRLWSTPPLAGWGLALVEAGAFAFAWWARLHLGRLWSGTITLREGHRVVDTGPYRLVRHPIYTGFLAASWAFALQAPAWTVLIGAAILTAQMAWKARREEAFLREELGAAAYGAYAARTPMLIPFVRLGRA